MPNLKLFTTVEGIEYVIDQFTGEAFVTQRGYSRMSGINQSTISRRCEKLDASEPIKKAEMDTGYGFKLVSLIPAKLCFKWSLRDNLELAEAMGEAGATVYIHQQVGFKISSTATQQNQQNLSDDNELGSVFNFRDKELTVTQQINILHLILQYLKIGHNSLAYAIAQTVGIRVVAEASDNVALAVRVNSEILKCFNQNVEPPQKLIDYIGSTPIPPALQEAQQLIKEKIILTASELFLMIKGYKSTVSQSTKLQTKLKKCNITPHTVKDGKHAYIMSEKFLEIAKEICREI